MALGVSLACHGLSLGEGLWRETRGRGGSPTCLHLLPREITQMLLGDWAVTVHQGPSGELMGKAWFGHGHPDGPISQMRTPWHMEFQGPDQGRAARFCSLPQGPPLPPGPQD